MADYTREISNSSGTLPADTGESAPPSSGGGGVKTISSQSDISSYTPSLGDILHVTIPTAVGATLDFSSLTLEGITIIVEDQTQASSSNYGELIFGDVTSTSISMKSNGTTIKLIGNIQTTDIITSSHLKCTTSAAKTWDNSNLKCSNFIIDSIVSSIQLNNINITTTSLEQGSGYNSSYVSNTFFIQQNNNLDIGYLTNSFTNSMLFDSTGVSPQDNSSRIILKREITGRNLKIEDTAGMMSHNSSSAVELIGTMYTRSL